MWTFAKTPRPLLGESRQANGWLLRCPAHHPVNVSGIPAQVRCGCLCGTILRTAHVGIPARRAPDMARILTSENLKLQIEVTRGCSINAEHQHALRNRFIALRQQGREMFRPRNPKSQVQSAPKPKEESKENSACVPLPLCLFVLSSFHFSHSPFT